MLRRCSLLSILLFVTSSCWAQVEATPDCRYLYSQTDPELFDFVKTRKRVEFDQYEGMTVGTIEYITLPIFNENDPTEDHWLFKLANKLHINTRSSTLERQLVFSSGEPLQAILVRESERILRDNGYLVDAMILPTRICGNQIDLLVVARDVWTISPSASASRSGGDNKSDYGISEKNLLGTGQSISLGHYQNSDRHGNNFSYRHPNIIGEHTSMKFGLEKSSDGEGSEIELVRPFYELDATWQAGIEYSQLEQVETIERQDREVNKYRHYKKNGKVFYGWSQGRKNDVVTRWTAGLASSEETYEAVDAPISNPPEDRLLRYPWLRWSSIEDNFATLSNITHSHRNEDVLVGFRHSINVGYASESWDSSQDAWIFSADTYYTAGFGQHHLLRLSIGANGRYDLDTNRPENTFYSGGAQYYNYPTHKKRWYMSAHYIVGRNLDDDAELTAGGKDNLRGYPTDYQRGNKQWLVRMEGRYFTDYHLLSLAYLGGAAYIDAGRTWDSTTSDQEESDDTLANLGFGLRFSPSKFNIDKVLHADIAIPLVNRDEVDSYQVILSGRVDF